MGLMDIKTTANDAINLASQNFTVMALHTGVVPPTINLDNPGEGCDLDYVPHTAREKKIDVAVSNGFGFGGTNGTLVFKRI